MSALTPIAVHEAAHCALAALAGFRVTLVHLHSPVVGGPYSMIDMPCPSHAARQEDAAETFQWAVMLLKAGVAAEQLYHGTSPAWHGSDDQGRMQEWIGGYQRLYRASWVKDALEQSDERLADILMDVSVRDRIEVMGRCLEASPSGSLHQARIQAILGDVARDYHARVHREAEAREAAEAAQRARLAALRNWCVRCQAHHRPCFNGMWLS